jgi:hypothetical protein
MYVYMHTANKNSLATYHTQPSCGAKVAQSDHRRSESDDELRHNFLYYEVTHRPDNRFGYLPFPPATCSETSLAQALQQQ